MSKPRGKNVVFKILKLNEEEAADELDRLNQPRRPSVTVQTIRPNYSIISLSQVTEASLEIWRTLPAAIRQDPSLASFRQEHERLHGE